MSLLMANSLTLAWTPGADASSQTVQYRAQTSGSWIQNTGITPANPLSSATSSAVLSGLATNTLYEVQVLSGCCPGSQTAGPLKHGITYEQQTLTPVTGSAGLIHVNQTAIPDVNVITYTVAVSTTPGTNLATAVANGSNPVATLEGALPTGHTYIISYKYGTTIDGVLVQSNDAAQHGSLYTQNFTM